MENIELKGISKKDVGKEYYVTALVKGIRQTSGPTVFELKDNSGAMKATRFTKAGERAFPDISNGDNLQAKVLVKERNDLIELEIISYEKISEKVIKEISMEEKHFLIKSEKLEKMRPLFIRAAEEIKKAAEGSRPIIIRHHDDVDGYVCGLALEKAIKPIVEGSTDRPYLYLTRSSSRTPYYDYIDALRDLNNHLLNKARYDLKAPLIILSDLGSNSQSMLSMRRLALYGITFVIVDHHRFDEQNKKNAEVFLNPQLFGFGSELNAGALAAELALFINPEISGLNHLPALSGTADKSSGEEYERYVKISGFDKVHLEKWGIAADHELYYLKFQESSDMLDDILYPTQNNSKIIDSVMQELEKEFSSLRDAVKRFAKTADINGFKLIKVDKEKTASYGDYASSKITRIANELFLGPRITMAESEDSISFRADGVDFSMVALLEEMKKKFPYALLNGGGHDCAGNIKFNSASKEEIIEYIMGYLEKVHKST